MPTILRIRGYRFFFFSNEYREKPHIHVESAGKYAKFWIEPVSLARNEGFNSIELNSIAKTIEKKRKILMEAWNG